MREDRYAPPSYNYEPAPLPPRRCFRVSRAVLMVWFFIALALAFEIYATIQLYPEHAQ